MKNLFFKEYIPFLRTLLLVDRMSAHQVIFIFLFSINFFKATAVENQPPVQNIQAVIYVSGNAQVYGTINNAVIIDKDKNQAATLDIGNKETKKQLSEIRIASVKKKATYKKLAEKIKSVKKRVFYTSTSKSKLKDFYLNKIGPSAVSLHVNTSLKYASTKISESNLVVKYNTQLQKQKFYTSLSYLQFEKFCSAALRGPPINS